jgi:uncharacterized membrane protein YsdA (DUF1294 family)
VFVQVFWYHEHMKRRNRKPYSSAFVLWLLAVVVVSISLISTFTIDPLYVFLIAVNAATFLMYGFDKWQATRRGDRVPENVLYAVTLLGGTAGALIGMHTFRHKTRKTSFQIVVALIMLIQIGLIAWLVW